MTDSIIVAYCTCPDPDTAAAISRTIVEQRLAACVNVVPGIRSFYRWEDRVEDSTEVLLVIKTLQSRIPALTEKISEIHPYDVPELIATKVEAGLPAYLDWVRAGSIAEPR